MKFHGVVGFSETVEAVAGVWRDVITERSYSGEIIRAARQLQQGEGVNPNLTVQNSITIVADQYANEHFFAIRYCRWAGVFWVVEDVTIESPRLILRLGGVYNGPKA